VSIGLTVRYVVSDRFSEGFRTGLMVITSRSGGWFHLAEIDRLLAGTARWDGGDAPEFDGMSARAQCENADVSRWCGGDQRTFTV